MKENQRGTIAVKLYWCCRRRLLNLKKWKRLVCALLSSRINIKSINTVGVVFMVWIYGKVSVWRYSFFFCYQKKSSETT